MKAKEIAQGLAMRADDVARHLLPGGKIVGSEYEVGGIDASPGKSLKVHLSGTKAGVWSDFASDIGGDLLDLWVAVNHLSMIDAMAEAKRYLGVVDPVVTSFSKPQTRPAVPDVSYPTGSVMEWLTVERGLSVESVIEYQVSANGNEVVFPSLIDEELVFCKFRSILDKKKMRVQSGSQACLFGWQAIPKGDRTVIICEGEIDALSWWDLGFPAMSVPNGAQGHSWVEFEYERLERFDKIYIAFDTDGPGREGALALANRLGLERCLLVDTEEFEDANDIVISGQTADAYVNAAKSIDPAELRQASSYVDEVIEMFLLGEDAGPGFNSPWSKLDGKLRFREAELCLLNGINGHGKSQLCGQLTLSAITQDKKVCIFSGEMPPKRLLYRLTRQATGLKEPTPQQIRTAHDWYMDRLWLFNITGVAKTERMLEVFEYTHRRYGVDVFVVDSLLKCGIADDDYSGQKAFVEALCDFKNQFGVTIFLVTHSRKGDNEFQRTGKMDVRGAGAISDLCDTLLTIFRNKKKEAEKSRAQAMHEDMPPDLKNAPDAILYCDKQRNGSWELQATLWWHDGANQYTQNELQEAEIYSQMRVVGQ
jgi:twinkle protein